MTHLSDTHPHRGRQVIKLLMLSVLLIAVTAGCAVRLAYNNLDWLTIRWVNQQVNLDGQQERQLRTALGETLEWHCATQLPEYASLLRDIETALNNNAIDASTLEAYGAIISAWGNDILERSRPSIVDLLATLDSDQIAFIAERFEEENKTLRQRIAEPDQQAWVDERARNAARSVRRAMGSSNGLQRQRIMEWAQQMQPIEAHQLAQSLVWQQRFLAVLEGDRQRPAFDESIGNLFEPGADWSDEFRALMTRNRALTLDMMVDVLELADDRQRERLNRRLQSFARDFERLSCEIDDARVAINQR
jgi:hypothetical protein